MDSDLLQEKSSVDKSAMPFIVGVTFILGIFLGFIGTSLVSKISQFSYEATIQDSSETYIQSKIDKVYTILKDKYINNLPSKDEVTQGMIKGMIGSLDDPYTIYLTPEEAEKYNESRNPDFEGVGVSLRYNGENTEVESVLRGYPAEGAGMKSGDVILKVDGTDVLGMYPSQVAGRIRGKKGTKVNLEVFRTQNERSEKLSFEIERVKVEIDNISYKNLGNGIVKIDIAQFVDTTPDQFNRSWDKTVESINKEVAEIKGVVIDLRNNPGGYVYSLRYLMDEFFTKGKVLMKEKQNDKEEVVYLDERNGKFENVPITIIVNEGSASASEIFAAAVQDHNRGEVVGTKTVGKGVEQEVIQIEDGSMLIVVFQKWLSPNGTNITKDSPITPDFEVEYKDEDIKANKDPQLQKALELVEE